MLKEIIKKTIGLFLATTLVVSAAACGKGSKGASSQRQNAISYSEAEIGAGSGLIWPAGSRINSAGRLVVFDRGDGGAPGFVTIEKDGKPTAGPKLGFEGNLRAFALDSQDNIYAVTAEDKNDGTVLQKLTILNPRGSVLKTLDLGSFNRNGGGGGLPNTGYTDIAVDAGGSVYLCDPSQGIKVLNKDGQPVKTIGSKGYESIDADPEGGIIAVRFDMEKKSLDKLDVSTGKSVWSADLSAGTSNIVRVMGSNKVRYSKADKSIFLMDSQGISRFDSTGKPAGIVIDFKAFSILASGYNITDMCVDGEGSIYVAAVSSSGLGKPGAGTGVPAAGGVKFELYRYSPQSAAGPAKDLKTITLSAPASNRALEMAASKFQKENPGYRIDIRTYPGQDNSGSDYEAYVKNLNTQMLSGNGPDIISVAGLPYDKYISKNILADLGEMMSSDKSFDSGKYYSNIFDAMKRDGRLYVLPTEFYFNVMMANQEILDKASIKIDDKNWTWKDFEAIAAEISRKAGSASSAGTPAPSALPSLSPLELLDLFTGGSYSGFIDKGGKSSRFNSAEFIELLNAVKSLGEGGISDNKVKTDMISVLEAAGRGAIVFYPYAVSDYNMYSFMKSAFKGQLGLYSIPSTGGPSGGAFSSNSLYSISRNSKYRQESWEFLKILLSDDVQSQNSQSQQQASKTSQKGSGGPTKAFGGFSVNKTAQQLKAQQAADASQKDAMKIMMKSPNGSITLSAAPLTREDIDGIDKFIVGLNRYLYTDASIGGIVQDEAKAFFEGAKSAEETSKLIQERVDTYLGE